MTLCKVNNTISNTRKCHEIFDWQNEPLEKIPNPKNNCNIQVASISSKDFGNNNITEINNFIQRSNQLIKSTQKLLEKNPIKQELNKHKITHKFFLKWRKYAKFKKEQYALKKFKDDKNKKLEAFVRKLKEKQKTKTTEDNNNNQTTSTKQITNNDKSIYKNRFNAQRTIIKTQKTQIDEQRKIIEELKLGIIREDIIKHTKIDIQDIFSDCNSSITTKLKIKAPLLLAVEQREKFMVSTQQAPKIVQKLEHRAIERANNRQIILERKKIIEETRQKLLEEAIQKKKVLEEDEKKRYLEQIKEQRRKDLEKEKVRQIAKQIYNEKEAKAIKFCNRKLLKRYFKQYFDYFLVIKDNNAKAEGFYRSKILGIALNGWLRFVEDRYSLKYSIADNHARNKILISCLKYWREFRVNSIRSRQVAEDIYDFRLTSNTFIYWHRCVCKAIIERDRKLNIATEHYYRKILFQYFYQWRSLRAVLLIEKAKEDKKRRWREKVLEILPNYKPCTDILDYC